MLTYSNFYPENLSRLEKITIFFIGITPIGYYLHPAWLSNLYAISSLLCIISLALSKDKYPLSKETKFACLIFIAYPLAIFLSQFFRWEWQLKAYHDQSRFLLAIPIFIFLYKKKIDISKLLSIAIPITIFIGLISSEFIYTTSQWGERRSVSFIDPLAFGLMNLTLGLACLPPIVFSQWNRQNLFRIILLSLGMIVGIFQSIFSQSRTGWLALLVIPFLLLIINYRSRGFKRIHLFAIFGGILFFIGFFSFEIVHVRSLTAYKELIYYPWKYEYVAHDSSFSMRITSWRIGWFYFTESPLWGWGNKGFAHLMESPEILKFASKNAIILSYESLFHSEFITQLVRFGFLGAISTAFVFFASFKYFIKHCFQGDIPSIPAMIGLTLTICYFISGLSNEVFNLKHMVSINAFLLACFLSSTLVESQRIN